MRDFYRHAACLVLACLATCVLLSVAHAADPPGPMKAATAVRLDGALTIDGKIDEAAWQKAPLQTGFERPLGPAKRDAIPADVQTSFRVLYDDTNLYFAVRCNEPSPDKLVSQAARIHDAAMWSDDDIELFIDPVGDRNEYYQLTINSEGTKVDLYMIERGNTGKGGWSSDWKTATFIGKDFWSLEVAIPFGLFHNRPSKMWADRWVFSVSRTRSVTPGNYYSQFSPAYRYHDIANFGYLAGLKVDKSLYNIYADSPQYRLEPTEGGYKVFPSLMVENRGDKAFAGALVMDILAPGAKAVRAPLQLAANASTRVTLPESFVKEQGKWPVIFRAEHDKGPAALVMRCDNWLTYTPITIKLSQPNYRNCIYATQQVDTIKGTLALGMPLDTVRGLTARVTLSSSLMAPKTTDVKVDSLSVPFELPAQDLVIGNYTLRAELLKPIANPKPDSPKAELIAEKETTVRKLPPAPSVEVRVDDQGNLIIDGQPVFIRGWYGSMAYVVSQSSFPQAQTPHSTNFMMGASDYESSNMNLYSLGSVARDVDEAKAKLDQPIDNELKAKVRAQIAAMRNKRNIIGYYISDEPECRGLSPVFLQSLYEFMAQEDPYRFCKIVSRDPVEFLQACDVMCPHPYMSPMLDDEGNRKFGSPIRSIHNNIADAVAANDGSKAIWCMPQTFSYGGLRGKDPTFKESRWFAHTAIANGAKGMVPFIFNGYWGHLENRIAMDYVFEELAFLAPAWNARDTATDITTDNPEIDVIAKHYKPRGAAYAHTFIVAANQSYQAGQATITVPQLAKGKNTRVIALRENRVIPVVDGKFNDIFEGLGVHIYTTLEVLPSFRSISEIEQQIASALDRPAKAGNLLADKKVKWAIGEFGMNFNNDTDIADGAIDAAGWIPVYGDRTQCAIIFDTPVTFSRVEFSSPTIRDADLDIWVDGNWKTIFQWKDGILPNFAYKGAAVTTDRVRIKPTANKAHFASWVLPEITELGFYK